MSATTGRPRVGAARLHVSTANHKLIGTVVRDLPAFEDRAPADCGIITYAALCAAPYDLSRAVLEREGIYTPTGSRVAELLRLLRRDRSAAGRATGQYEGTSLRTFLRRHSRWTGAVVIVSPTSPVGRHMVPVVNGVAINVTSADYDEDATVALRTGPRR